MNYRSWPKCITLLSLLLLCGCGAPSFDVDIAWSSSSQPDDTGEGLPPEIRPDPVEAPAAAEVVAPTAEELWQRALDSGMSAARLAQNAISPQDWELVAARWGRAIDVLKTIPESAPNYAEVQAKIEQYSQNQTIAQQRYQRITAGGANPTATGPKAQTGAAAQTPQSVGQAPRPATNPAAQNSAAAIALCQGVKPNAAGQPIEVSNLRFYRPPATPYDFGSSGFAPDPAEDYLIGCLTNNSSQAFSTVSMEYTSRMASHNGYSFAGLSLPVQVIQPGATVPFRSPLGIDPDAIEILVTKLTGLDSSYQPIKTAEPQLKIPYSPSPAAPPVASPAQLCAAVRPTKPNQAFEVNQLQLYQPPHDPYNFEAKQGTSLVGCITNHSTQTLSSLGLSYSDSSSFGGGFATVSVPGDGVLPGQTVPFRKFGTIDADEVPITIQTMGSNVGDIDVGVTVTR